jgi:thiosulfate dehydrogenase [quinone] large subunit
VIGEMAIGVGLILGALTGIAAFFGATLNMTFLLAGTVSSNPILLLITMILILAWRVAGWIGVDYILLPRLGVPWNPGTKAMHHPGGGSAQTS